MLTASLYDGSVRRWDNLSGTEMEECRHASDYVSALAISPDGTRVLAGSFDGCVFCQPVFLPFCTSLRLQWQPPV